MTISCSLLVEDKALNDKDTLEKHGIKDGDRLYFKDLGHQVGYRTVSLICSTTKYNSSLPVKTIILHTNQLTQSNYSV